MALHKLKTEYLLKQLTKKDEYIAELESKVNNQEPMWIGIELPHHNGNIKICIGINQEDGHEISFCNQADIEQSPNDPWNFDGDIVVKYGENEQVFDKDHKLITTKYIANQIK